MKKGESLLGLQFWGWSGEVSSFWLLCVGLGCFLPSDSLGKEGWLSYWCGLRGFLFGLNFEKLKSKSEVVGVT